MLTPMAVISSEMRGASFTSSLLYAMRSISTPASAQKTIDPITATQTGRPQSTSSTYAA